MRSIPIPRPRTQFSSAGSGIRWPRPTVFGEEVRGAAGIGVTYAAISASELPHATAGAFLSVVTSPDGQTRAISEPPRDDATKVHLILLNLGSAPARIIVQEAGTEVVAPVASDGAGLRAVNPVSVALAVERVSDGAILGSFDLRLSRGQDLTFVARADGAEVIENSFGPVLRLR